MCIERSNPVNLHYSTTEKKKKGLKTAQEKQLKSKKSCFTGLSGRERRLGGDLYLRSGLVNTDVGMQDVGIQMQERCFSHTLCYARVNVTESPKHIQQLKPHPIKEEKKNKKKNHENQPPYS